MSEGEPLFDAVLKKKKKGLRKSDQQHRNRYKTEGDDGSFLADEGRWEG